MPSALPSPLIPLTVLRLEDDHVSNLDAAPTESGYSMQEPLTKAFIRLGFYEIVHISIQAIRVKIRADTV